MTMLQRNVRRCGHPRRRATCIANAMSHRENSLCKVIRAREEATEDEATYEIDFVRITHDLVWPKNLKGARSRLSSRTHPKMERSSIFLEERQRPAQKTVRIEAMTKALVLMVSDC